MYFLTGSIRMLSAQCCTSYAACAFIKGPPELCVAEAEGTVGDVVLQPVSNNTVSINGNGAETRQRNDYMP